MVIGLAGKTGSGKNFVASLLEQQGFVHYDMDKKGHLALEACKTELVQSFGESILNSNGKVDRKTLGTMVFSRKTNREKLQNILYPWLEEYIRKEIPKNPKIIINGALLSESKMQLLCHRVLWIEAPFGVRWARLKGRDGISGLALFRRIYSQRFLKPQLFSSEVDIEIIKNPGDSNFLSRQLNEVLESLD